MQHSTEKRAKTLQNQSNNDENVRFQRFYDSHVFDDNHVWPYGSLWRYIPDFSVNWLHAHDHLEIGRCVKGSGIYNIGDKLFRVQAPCYAIIYEGAWHSATGNVYDNCEWNFLYIDTNWFLQAMPQFAQNFKGLNWRKYSFPQIMSAAQYPQIARIIDAIFDESSHVRENNLPTLTGLIVSLLAHHSEYMTPNENGNVIGEENIARIAPALSYITSSFSLDMTIKELADMCFTSEATLRRLFYDFSGKSPMEYLHDVRIKNGALLLTTTKKPIIEIASDIGYSTVSSFNRQFSLHYGCSPRDYRKSHKE